MNFTVVIPTCRRPEMLARCLNGLPNDADVVVTDDGGDAAMREELARRFPHVRFIEGPRRGPAANRNNGAKAASGDWVAFVDDDCVPQPGWLGALADAAQDADVVEGRTTSPGASDSPFKDHVENETGGVLWSCNLAVQKDRFLALGGFDEDFKEAGGEDMEFAWRTDRAGLRVKFASRAVVHHPHRRIGWRGIWKRIWMIGWMSLYRLKTGDGPALGASFLRVASTLLSRETMMVLRTAAHCITRPSKNRRMQAIHAALRVLTFPVVLPYMLVWEIEFRRQLGERISMAGGAR